MAGAAGEGAEAHAAVVPERVATHSRKVREALLVAMAAASGCVDAISYFALGRVFTSNMTGNVVLLGLAVGQGEGIRALRSAVAFAGFALGALIGAFVAGHAERGRASPVGLWPARVTMALGIELVMLAGFLAGWEVTGRHPAGAVGYVLVVVNAVAMGVQSAAVHRLRVPGVTTTYVTGTLTGLMSELLPPYRPSEGRLRRAGVIAAVFAGAAVGAILLIRTAWAAPVVPVALLAAVVVTAVLHYRPDRRWNAADQEKREGG